MRIEFNEIWEFMEMAPAPKNAEKGAVWNYKLVAGSILINNLYTQDILDLNKEENYDTELLPSLFTFREILWQPNVYTQPEQCIPQLNILKSFCDEYIQSVEKTRTTEPYMALLQGLSTYCTEAIEKIVGVHSSQEVKITAILGELRKKAFPLIKFFIFHPMNRKDYQTDALNRLNYAVKIMLTQYHNHYYDLQDPYWKVSVGRLSKSQSQTEKMHVDSLNISADLLSDDEELEQF
ncbi:hypothetical protein N6H18_02950 [Reichenbachiella agarivorans]|uniref:Uncharacterized protein n=1 Tax=Reichenbachiella agarivorans TaxID=2979464 RepID=A0ABY6CQX6_9BACT|nr:hypothetical protein [Reichenbachiella agarivorans]UXP32912.1 hypothetical protein N6H18_02950 [Reichenbachiella agarivorans]